MVLSRMTAFCTKKALLSILSGKCRTSFATATVDCVLFSYFNLNCLVQRRPQVCHYCATLAFTKNILGHAYKAEYSWMGGNFSLRENIIE